MFMTRFAVNPARRQGRFLLSSPQAMHAAVMASFPPAEAESADAGRVLWRIDQDGHATWLFIVSPRMPQLTHLAEQAGWSDSSTWTTKDYRPLLSRLETGQEWAFRLHANPVHQIKREKDGKKVRVGHVTPPQQTQWLLDRTEGCGFTIIEHPSGAPDVLVSQRQKRGFRRESATVTLSTAQFDGHLRVTNPDLLRTSMIQGIGRAKGYGCGLLTLAQPSIR